MSASREAKGPKPARWIRRLNGAGMDPKVGYPADEVAYHRLPDGVRMVLKVRGQIIASIDGDPSDVRAWRDALTQVLKVLGS